jgi:hypothetical protein
MARPTEIVDALCDAADEGNPVSAEQIADHLDRRGIGALLMMPAALEITPVGGIPGVPTILAAMVALCAVQIVFGREDLWMPGFLARRTVSADKLRAGADWLRPPARWADRHLAQHLTFLTTPPASRAAAAVVVLLCLTVPPLELVPFASTLPMGTAVLFGLALVTQDGRLMMLFWLAVVASFWGVFALWP